MRLYRRRQTSSRPWQVIGVLAVVGYVLVQFVTFQLSLGRVPATWTIGGQTYPDQPIDAAVAQVQIDLQDKPVRLHYLSDTVELQPTVISYTVDVTETMRVAREARYQSAALTDFIRHLFFQPPAARDVPAVIGYSDERLRAELAALATRFDRPALPPQPVTSTMTLQAGQPGYQLNIVASIAPIETALQSAAERTVDLIVDDQPAPPITLDQLSRLFQARLTTFDGAAGIFVKDLRTGGELSLNANTPYAGGGVLKLPMLIEAYRQYESPWPAALTQWMTTTLRTEASTAPADEVLTILGNGDAAAGANKVTASMTALGLKATRLPQPFTPPVSATLPVEAVIQTTPAEIGVLLEMVYQCRQGGGALLVAFADAFTPEKCAALLDELAQHSPADVPSLLRGGVPDANEVLHRPGGTASARADAALVTSPGGDYVLVVFLSAEGRELDWNGVNPIFNDLAKATYNYFNPK
ncbi:MAG: serine hydrolase [Chloroflexi bacterium]|nr:serine hydrolase [Chloroflexota bacterium]